MEQQKIYKISSAENLWEPTTITVFKNTIIESSDKRCIDIGSNFDSMCKYWNSFDGDNKYLITLITDENISERKPE